MSFSIHTTEKSSSHSQRRIPTNVRQPVRASPGLLQRKPNHCACGGSCPRCQAASQLNLKIGDPDDRYEREADAVAERVMRMTDASAVSRAAPALQRKCAACEEQDDEQILQAKTDVATASRNEAVPAEAPMLVHQVLESPGRPLDAVTRDFFESRFGRDFGAVRVHSDARAAESARVVNALAYTVGRDLVFGEGSYAPDSGWGKELLAHELTHHLQQSSAGPRVQRRLLVDPNHPSGPPVSAPATDPAAALTPATRWSMMNSIIGALCPDFSVDSNTGEIVNSSSANRITLTARSTPTGCCCLAVLVDTTNTWTIEVSQVLGPHTRFGSHQVVLSPTSTPVEFGSFTSAGSLAFQGQVPAAGHELCGHAALQELGAHPTGDRLTTDVHDPTVRIENRISTEQGVPASALRGLAGSGTHRGESVDRISVSQYPLNGTDPSGLPASERDKLQFAAQYAVANDSWVDILGHSDPVGSSTAKQHVSQERANKAKLEMTTRLGVPPTITKPGLVAVPRFTRVEGVSDTQPPPVPLAANHANWRRIDVLIAGFPAGAQVPPAGTSSTVTPIAPPVVALTTPVDPCAAVLIGGAFPSP